MQEQINKTKGPQYVTIEQVVLDALVDENETNATHKFQQYLRWAIRGLEEMSADGVIRNTKTVPLTLNSYRAADLPADFMDWITVGVKDGDHISPFYSDPRLLVYYNTDDCGDALANNSCITEEETSRLIGANYWFGGYGDSYRNGDYVGGAYGIGGHSRSAVFNIDYDRHQIVFGSGATGEILLEYRPTVYNPDGQTYVHIYVREALIAFIHWKRIAQKEYISRGDKVAAERHWWNMRRNANMRLKTPALRDMLNHLRKYNTQSPKT